jgi:hypothetical protein
VARLLSKTLTETAQDLGDAAILPLAGLIVLSSVITLNSPDVAQFFSCSQTVGSSASERDCDRAGKENVKDEGLLLLSNILAVYIPIPTQSLIGPAKLERASPSSHQLHAKPDRDDALWARESASAPQMVLLLYLRCNTSF